MLCPNPLLESKPPWGASSLSSITPRSPESPGASEYKSRDPGLNNGVGRSTRRKTAQQTAQQRAQKRRQIGRREKEARTYGTQAGAFITDWFCAFILGRLFFSTNAFICNPVYFNFPTMNPRLPANNVRPFGTFRLFSAMDIISTREYWQYIEYVTCLRQVKLEWLNHIEKRKRNTILNKLSDSFSSSTIMPAK